MESAGTQTMISVGPDEELLVQPKPLVKPLGIHFAVAATSSGKRPPIVPTTPARSANDGSVGRVGRSSEAQPQSQHTQSHSQMYPHSHPPGPLYFNSPGLSPISANFNRKDKVGKEEEGQDEDEDEEEEAEIDVKGDDVDDSSLFMGRDRSIVGAAERDFDGEDYRLVSVHALDERTLQQNTTKAGEYSTLLAQDASLQAMSFLVTDDSAMQTRRASPGASKMTGSKLRPSEIEGNKIPSSVGRVFSIALDEQGSPVIVQLQQHQQQPSSASLHSGSYSIKPASAILHTSTVRSSSYWSERLNRRSLSSVLSSPLCIKFL